jgi:hypothetical protein
MDCNVEGCEAKATQRYVWAWGEEGVCCDNHRAHLETNSAQLGRSISFTALDRKSYSSPTAHEIAPDVGALRMRLAELIEESKAKDDRIGALMAELGEAKLSLRKLEMGLPTEAPAPAPAPAPAADVTETTPTEVRRTRR